MARRMNATTLDELIARTVDGAPEPTPEQIEAIAAVLSPPATASNQGQSATIVATRTLRRAA